MNDLNVSGGERVVVFGATGGIGGALCERLRARGADVVAVARDTDRLVALAERLGVTPVSLDATDLDAVDGCLRDAVSDGPLTGVANCVGSILIKPAARTSAAEWQQVLAQNLTTAFAVTRAAGARMRAGGSVVLVASAAGRLGLSNHEGVAAAKAGVIGLALSAAASHARRGLRVNVVAPGLVDTPMSAPFTRDERVREASAKMHPLGRIGQPGDVASAIAWLLHPENSWITGQVLGVDGGLASVRPPA